MGPPLTREGLFVSDRISCLCPGCRRTYHNREGYNEWICGNHWRLVSPTARRRYSKLRSRYKRRFGTNGFWHYPAGSPNRIEAVRLDRLCGKAWEKVKIQAIERSVGI